MTLLTRRDAFVKEILANNFSSEDDNLIKGDSQKRRNLTLTFNSSQRTIILLLQENEVTLTRDEISRLILHQRSFRAKLVAT